MQDSARLVRKIRTKVAISVSEVIASDMSDDTETPIQGIDKKKLGTFGLTNKNFVILLASAALLPMLLLTNYCVLVSLVT